MATKGKKYYTDIFKVVIHLWIICVIIMLLRLFVAALLSPAGKALTTWFLFVMFNCVFVSFPCGILGHVWYLIVSILDLCRLSYIQNLLAKKKTGRFERYNDTNGLWVTFDQSC